MKRLRGRWPSGQWHQTVNLTEQSYGGSNPSLPTANDSDGVMHEKKIQDGGTFREVSNQSDEREQDEERTAGLAALSLLSILE